MSATAPSRPTPGHRPPALVLRWDESNGGLPVREVRPTHGPDGRPPVPAPPPGMPTGPPGRPFDFTGRVRRLCADLAARCPDLRHIDPARVLVAVAQARSPRRHGLQARLTPLRFEGGALTQARDGHTFRVQRYFLGGLEYLYLLNVCLPRFLDLPFDDKVLTLVHELYHISPAFDGDLRRHPGRFALHTRRHDEYDRRMAELARAYLASGPDPGLHAFLRLTFAQLMQKHGSVIGVTVPRPKIVPLEVR